MKEPHNNYAGFWRRFAAYVIDMSIIYYVLTSLHSDIAGRFRIFLYSMLENKQDLFIRLVEENLFLRYVFDRLLYSDLQSSDYYNLVAMITNNWANIILVPISIFFVWSYYSGMESSPFQATIGKLAVGIFVTDSNGERLSFARATGRYFGKIISGISILIGYVIAGFTIRKQALHDFIAGTLVLRK